MTVIHRRATRSDAHLRRSRRRTATDLIGAAALLGALTACGDDAALAEAEEVGTTVGDAVQARSEETGDITTAIAEEPWAGDADPYVTGRWDSLVVNLRDGACAELVFAADEAGADYTVEDTYECGEVGEDVG